MYLLSFVYLLWRNIYSSPLLIFKLGSLFIVALYELFIFYSGCSILIRYMTCKYYLSSRRLSFHFLDNVLWSTKVLNFHEVHFVFIFFVAYAFGVMCMKLLSNTRAWGFTLFPSKNFLALNLTFTSLIHFEDIFYLWCEIGV